MSQNHRMLYYIQCNNMQNYIDIRKSAFSFHLSSTSGPVTQLGVIRPELLGSCRWYIEIPLQYEKPLINGEVQTYTQYKHSIVHNQLFLETSQL